MVDKTVFQANHKPAIFRLRDCELPIFDLDFLSIQQRNKLINTDLSGKEVQFMVKAQSVGVETPAIYIVDSENTKIVMERVDGITVEQFLKEKMQGDPAAALRVVGDMGTAVARMHDAQIIHGDLTTSNFMVRNQPPRRIVVIDFGLSFSESLPEEKAVDLYVLEQALLLSHAGSEPLVKEMLRSYAASSDKKLGVATLQELIEVRDRRRKRDDEMPEQSQDQLE